MKALLLILVPTLILAPPARAERWRQVPGAADATLSIDLDSIRREGNWRVFRSRTSPPGVQGAIIGVVAMDCAAGITELRAQRHFIRGKLMRERVFPSAKRPRQKVPHPGRDAAFRMVCAA